MKLFSRKTEKKKNSKLATDGKPILKFTQEEQFEFSGNSVYTSTFSRLKIYVAD